VGFFRPNLLDCRKVKDLSLAEQLYLYERTRRFKDPPFGKQQKTAVGVFFFNWKKHGKNISTSFLYLVVWRWVLFFLQTPNS